MDSGLGLSLPQLSLRPAPMHPLRSLALYLLAVFGLGALLAPWLFALAQWAGERLPLLAPLAGHPFHRYVHRSLLLVALVGLWPFLRSIQVRSWRDLGVVSPVGRGRDLATGFAVGFASLAAVAALALAFGGRHLAPEPRWDRLFHAVLTAVAVAGMEEVLFRGALFGALRKVHHWLTALGVSSVVYALVHFFQRPPAPARVSWSSGLEMLPQMLKGFTELPSLAPGFFVLTLAGAILAWAFHRTGDLWCAFGLHAGWVFWLKSYGAFTSARPEACLPFWGSHKLVDGWLAGIVLAGVLGLLPRLLPWHGAPPGRTN
mgnify:CR=1 FL=1